jgi:hypothetical protein
MSEPIDSIYLPFSEEQLDRHLARRDGLVDGVEADRGGIEYYLRSAARYHRHTPEDRLRNVIGELKYPRQIEKDERFWTAACLLAFQYCGSPKEHWINLLVKCFGERPLSAGFDSWAQLLGNNPTFLLEAPLPSPQGYSKWLRQNIKFRNLVRYVLDSVPQNPLAKLEGFTHADAILISEDTGFSLVFESKVMSDISCQVTFDGARNQIARIIDVMLEPPSAHLNDVLGKRKPNLSYFALLTPRLFKEIPSSRLYGWLMNEYQKNPTALLRDLPNRKDEAIDWVSLSKRIGWITWDDCNEILPGACRWLSPRTATDSAGNK